MDRIDSQFYNKICQNSDFLMFGPYEFLNLRNFIYSQRATFQGINCFGSIYIGDVCLDVLLDKSKSGKSTISLRISLPGKDDKLIYMHDIEFRLPTSLAIDLNYPQFIRTIQTKAARINNSEFRYHASRITDFWHERHIHQGVEQ